jgi:peptidoglycan hydrolase-like protein with peptidoglycan-binding domain
MKKVRTIVTKAGALICVASIVTTSFAFAIEQEKQNLAANGPITQIDYIHTPGNDSFNKTMLPSGPQEDRAFNVQGVPPPTGSTQQPNSTSGLTETPPQKSCELLIIDFHSVGARGEAVATLQRFLNQYNHAEIPVTGYYGQRTRAAVMQLQSQYGIPVTGNQYNLTTTLINALHCQFGSQALTAAPVAKNTATCPAYLSRFTSLGDRSVDVAKLQLILNVYENAQLPVTGYFGQRTKAAVMNFQTKHSIVPVNGEQFELTTAALNEAYCNFGGTEVTVTPIVPSTRAGYVAPQTPTVHVASAASSIDVSPATNTAAPRVSVSEGGPDVAAQSSSAYGDWILLFYTLAAIGLIWVVFADVQ